MSLIQFRDRVATTEGDRLFWGRAEEDGAPFRGAQLPLLTEEEYARRVVRVAIPKNGYFDSRDPAQNAAYLQAMEAIVNGWYKCVYIERFWRETSVHYMEWIEYYMQDGSPTPYLAPGTQESAYGAANGTGASGPHSPV